MSSKIIGQRFLVPNNDISKHMVFNTDQRRKAIIDFNKIITFHGTYAKKFCMISKKKQKKKKIVIINDGSFKCPRCSKRFKQKWEVARHVRVHTNERPFKCNFCGKRFKQKAHLKNHVEKYVHNPNKNFSCLYCSKKFKTERIVEIHVRNIHKL